MTIESAYKNTEQMEPSSVARKKQTGAATLENKVKIHLPHIPGTSLCVIYPRQKKIYVRTKSLLQYL